jgi:hypothetical protein
MLRKKSHRHSPESDRRTDGERRTQSRRVHHRVTVTGNPIDRRREERRETKKKKK